MNVQFGRWNFEGQPLTRDSLDRLDAMLTPYGPDRANTYSEPGIHILHRAFHTTSESHCETQPRVTLSGDVLTWDGSLDNRLELVQTLGSGLSNQSPDVDIVAAAHERWGLDCLGKLIGDWALSIWSPKHHTLILAKDFAGVRPLYYSTDERQITWSSLLEPIVLLAGRSFSVNEEYIAGWLSFFPGADLTPYVGIRSVPPSCYVRFRKGQAIVTRHWQFDPQKTIRHSTDFEYEEHFRAVFGAAVRRRLRADAPIVAELSGGMDSSSIVCIADEILSQDAGHVPLHTVSYHNEREPNWNEMPYFTKVEQRRGVTGCHIDLSFARNLRPGYQNGRFAATPNAALNVTASRQQFSKYLVSLGARVVLSGIGGDEVMGGVPTPVPTLADLLVRARFRTLARQLRIWAVSSRKPWIHLLGDTLRCFLPRWLVFPAHQKKSIPWLSAPYSKRHRAALQGYRSRLHVLGGLPSFQEHLNAFEMLRRQLACSHPPCKPPYEKRFPYLDRDLLEFLYAIPRDQLLRPGQRRSLMRRALVGIVPHEILNRRRKAFVTRTPVLALSDECPDLLELTQNLVTSRAGIVEQQVFAGALQKARQGLEINVGYMIRTLALEDWLQHLTNWSCIVLPITANSFQKAERFPTSAREVEI